MVRKKRDVPLPQVAKGVEGGREKKAILEMCNMAQ
jgi:hypothetical protein